MEEAETATQTASLSAGKAQARWASARQEAERQGKALFGEASFPTISQQMNAAAAECQDEAAQLDQLEMQLRQHRRRREEIQIHMPRLEEEIARAQASILSIEKAQSGLESKLAALNHQIQRQKASLEFYRPAIGKRKRQRSHPVNREKKAGASAPCTGSRLTTRHAAKQEKRRIPGSKHCKNSLKRP